MNQINQWPFIRHSLAKLSQNSFLIAWIGHFSLTRLVLIYFRTSESNSQMIMQQAISQPSQIAGYIYLVTVLAVVRLKQRYYFEGLGNEGTLGRRLAGCYTWTQFDTKWSITRVWTLDKSINLERVNIVGRISNRVDSKNQCNINFNKMKIWSMRECLSQE